MIRCYCHFGVYIVPYNIFPFLFTPSLDCPEYDTDYSGNDIGGTFVGENVLTWQACRALCAQTSGCLYWTWISDTWQDVNRRLLCYAKSSDAGRGALSDHVSGEVSCGALGG